MKTTFEKRKLLTEFCHNKLCSSCCLNDASRCGRGVHFETITLGSFNMTDEEIAYAYAIAFPNDSDERIDPMITAIVPRPGLAPDAPVVENEQGGRQSHSPYAFHLLPTNAIFAAAEVAKAGADKYGESFGNRNYVKIPVEDHINHCIQHLYGYLSGDTSDDHLGHAIVRAMFAYDVAMRNCQEKHNEDHRL